MRENPGLIEPSFKDGIATILADDNLSEQLKRHWTTSMRQFAKATGRPLEVIPARWCGTTSPGGTMHRPG